MTELVQVGLSWWIIADGNYEHFSVGDLRSFALQYWNEDELKPASMGYGYEHLAGSRYSIAGRRVHFTPTWCVIDFGLLAYRELHAFPRPPTSFTGDLFLGVDPFCYFERLAHEADAPPLIYNWRVHRIEVETAPRIMNDGMLVYDPEKRKSVDVQDTKRGEDFVLHCELLHDPPRKHLTYV